MTTDPTGPATARSAGAEPSLDPPQSPSSASTRGEPAERPAATPARREPDVASSVPPPPGTGVTRVSAVWVAVGVSLLFLVLLIVFILQNLNAVTVHFLGFSPSLPLGVALLIAAVTGGIVVAVAGAARVIQLRRTARRIRT